MTQHITHRIDKTLVVWIEKSNQWVLLHEPEQKVYRCYLEGKSRDEATGLLCREMGFQSAATLANNLYDSLHLLDKEGFPQPDFSKNAKEAFCHEITQSRIHHYQSNGKSFSIRYGSPFLETYIHQPFSHLSCENAGKETLLLEVFPFQERYTLRINESHCKTADESPQIKRLLFVELANYLYEIPEEGWMTRLHASAVHKDGKLLLLSSPSGSGKSTMAALLMKKGFKLFSDDYIPVCLEQKLLYPFPAALSIKAGSFPVLEKEGIHAPLISSQVGYIPPDQGSISPLKTTRMIFINYKSGSPTTLEEVTVSSALQLFLQEAWVSNHAEGAKQFIEWFSGLRFWQLQYSNNREGVDSLIKTF